MMIRRLWHWLTARYVIVCPHCSKGIAARSGRQMTKRVGAHMRTEHREIHEAKIRQLIVEGWIPPR